MNSQPWGLQGGLSGTSGHCVFRTKNGPVSGKTCNLAPGDLVEVVSPGAGGFGPPSRRAPDKVREDIRNRVVSAEDARRIYGPSAP